MSTVQCLVNLRRCMHALPFGFASFVVNLEFLAPLQSRMQACVRRETMGIHGVRNSFTSTLSSKSNNICVLAKFKFFAIGAVGGGLFSGLLPSEFVCLQTTDYSNCVDLILLPLF